MRWSLLRIQLIPNYSYMLWPNCWFSMDFGDLSSAPPPPFVVHPVPWPGFLSRQAFSEGFPAALLIFIFVSLSGPCYFAFSAVFPWIPDSAGFLSDSAFVSQLSQMSGRETSYPLGENSTEGDVCCSLLTPLSSLGLCGTKEWRQSRARVFPQTFPSCSFSWFLQDVTVLWGGGC